MTPSLIERLDPVTTGDAGRTAIFDKHGREIMRGDILRVYHYTGSRRKRHYMYKQAMGTRQFGGDAQYMVFDHLNLDSEHYHECCDGRVLQDHEIVQSIDCKFEERTALTSAKGSAQP